MPFPDAEGLLPGSFRLSSFRLYAESSGRPAFAFLTLHQSFIICRSLWNLIIYSAICISVYLSWGLGLGAWGSFKNSFIWLRDILYQRLPNFHFNESYLGFINTSNENVICEGNIFLLRNIS